MNPINAEVWGFYGPAWKDKDGHWLEACPACEEGVADFSCSLCSGRSILPVRGSRARYGLRKVDGKTQVVDRFKDLVVGSFANRCDAIADAHDLNYPQGART